MLPSPLLSMVFGCLTPREILAQAHLVCSTWLHTPGCWTHFQIHVHEDDNESRKLQAQAEVRALLGVTMKHQVQTSRLQAPFSFIPMVLEYFPNMHTVDLVIRASDYEFGRLVPMLMLTKNVMLELDESPYIGPCLTDAGLQHLSELKSALLKLKLYFCTKITVKGLAQLPAFANLHTLELIFCTNVSDDVLCYIAPLHNLQSLVLTNVDDRSLAHLRGLVNLHSLSLCGMSRLTDEGLKHLSVLPKLQQFELTGASQVTDVGLGALRELRELRVSESSVTGTFLQEITRIRPDGLRTLALANSPNITNESLRHLCGWSALRALNLEACLNLTDQCLCHLASLSCLEQLTLGDFPTFSDEALEFLSHLPCLTYLNLQGTCMAKQGFEKLKELKLQHLYVDADCLY
jgi:hypothetical protein